MPTRLNIYGQSISTTKKRPCIAATTTNIALSGATTPTIVDGVTISIGDRILVRQQNLSKDNGIYKLETSQLLSRDYDFNISNDLYAGIEVLVLSGLTYSGKTFYLTTTGNITIGSTSLTFDILAGQNGASGTSGTSGTSGSNAGITSYTNPADNRVITSVSASAINAEANLTFDGSTLVVSSTTGVVIPVGTTAQRPASPTQGTFRFNTTTLCLESFVNGTWYSLLTAAQAMVQIDIFVIAGGGNGGTVGSDTGSGGGGGAGGYITNTVYIPLGTYSMVVGGALNNSFALNKLLFAYRGGTGGSVSALDVRAGGSGGGGAIGGSGGLYYENQGNLGGDPGGFGGSGGGGAGSNGIPSIDIDTGGGGGSGITDFTGVNRAGGGGGGGRFTAGVGGTGGGGTGGTQSTSPTNGSANTGGGGGGVYKNFSSPPVGSGGSGIIVLRYYGSSRATGGTITSSGGYTIHTFTGTANFVLS